jgi:hypothetical protein
MAQSFDASRPLTALGQHVSGRLRPKLNVASMVRIFTSGMRRFVGHVISRPNKGGFLLTNCKLTSCALLSVFDAAPSQTPE